MVAKTRQISLILRHELLETFRDRNTLIYAIVVPIALYPVLFLILAQLLQLQSRIDASTTGIVEVRGGEGLVASPGSPGAAFEREEFKAMLRAHQARQPGRPLEIRWSSRPLPLQAGAFPILDEETGPHVVLEITPRSHQSLDGWKIETWFDPLSPVGKSVADDLFPALEYLRTAWRNRFWERRTSRPAEDLDLLRLETRDASQRTLRGARLPALLLPMILLLMGTIGAFYPAIDTTAGERERGTAETTAILPTARGHLALGKYLAVLCSALLAFALNLISMWLTWPLIRGSLGKAVPDAWQLSPLQTLALLAAGLAFLAFIAALMLAAALFARTFKEGQALLSPLYTLILLPAMASAIPGIRLNAVTALVPFLGGTLSLRAIVEGRLMAELIPILLAATTSLLLAAATLVVLVRSYASEQTLIGTEGSAGLLARLRRRGLRRIRAAQPSQENR